MKCEMEKSMKKRKVEQLWGKKDELRLKKRGENRGENIEEEELHMVDKQ